MNESQELGNRIIVQSLDKKINISELEKYASHESPYVRSAVAVALGNLGGNEAYALWKKLMQDSEELVVGDAIIAAAKLGDSRCIDKIIEAYNQYGYHLKTRVIIAMPYFKDQKAKDFLEKLKEEEKEPTLKELIESTEENN
ncbi:MAG: HEAT repeat domain-containing protein [Candidatus Woesearchaeota archaeon]